MATKKQKHLAGLAKRNSEMEELRRSGLAALRRAQAERFRESLQVWQKQHDEKHFKFIDECPHCEVIQRAIAQGRSHKDGVDEIQNMLSKVASAGPPVHYFDDELRRDLDIKFSSKEATEDRASIEMECA